MSFIHKLQGRATGVGSMPHNNVKEAIQIINNNLHSIPHWPQLPLRSTGEGFIKQYLGPLLKAGLVELHPEPSRQPFFCTNNTQWESRLLAYYDLVLEAEQGGASNEEFAFPQETAEGFYNFLERDWNRKNILAVKGQLTGPVTIGLQVTASDGSPAFYHDELREALIKTLANHARWQAAKLSETGKPVILFIDDPGIYGYGTSSYVGLGREAIQESLKEIITAVKAEDVLVGVHCCAGIDWSLLFELPLDIVNFDAYGYYNSIMVYTDSLNSYLEKGGLLAWGIVPTSSDKIEEENAPALYDLLEMGINNLAQHGVDRELLEKQIIITPSCGTTTLTFKHTEKVYRMLRELEEILIKRH